MRDLIKNTLPLIAYENKALALGEVELKTFGARNIHSSFMQVLHAAPTKRKTAIVSSFAVTFTFSFACFR